MRLDHRSGEVRGFFPNCWDGNSANLGSAADMVDFAYASGKASPSAFPIAISQLGLQFNVRDQLGKPIFNPYDANGNVRVSFASGPSYTAHADFLNSWNEPTLEELINGCLNGVGTCPSQG